MFEVGGMHAERVLMTNSGKHGSERWGKVRAVLDVVATVAMLGSGGDRVGRHEGAVRGTCRTRPAPTR